MLAFKARGLGVASGVLLFCLMSPPVALAQSTATADLTAEAAGDLRPRGAWSPTKTYVVNDLVTTRGSTWRAKQVSQGKVPGSTSPSTAADWAVFAVGLNPLGAWSNAATYHGNDLVTYLGTTWRAKRTNLNKAPNTNATDWVSFAARGAAGPNAVGNGSVAAPSIRFSSDSGTGIFSPEAGKIAMTESGALFLHNIGSFNAALGLTALAGNTTGASDTALGYGALASNTTGDENTALGRGALGSNVGGDNNTAVGVFALASSTQSGNTAVGSRALVSATSGNNNTAVGSNALFSNIVGVGNTAVGIAALYNTTTSGNIGVGNGAGVNATNPFNSVFIGNAGLAADTATIKVGTQGTQTSTFIAGIRGVTTGNNNAVAVLVDSAGQLGTVSSSRRYKHDIQPMGDASAALMKLRPVTFRYKKPYADGSTPIEYGLIAEEANEALPDLVVFNERGQPETIKYHLLPALLVNEYQRQQKTIEAQTKLIAAQEHRLLRLEAQLARLDLRAAKRGPSRAKPRMLAGVDMN